MNSILYSNQWIIIETIALFTCVVETKQNKKKSFSEYIRGTEKEFISIFALKFSLRYFRNSQSNQIESSKS